MRAPPPPARRAPRKFRNLFWKRRGSVIALSAFLMIVMLGFVALGVDTGYMYAMKSELQRAVDSAALAGAGSLVDDEDAANAMVVEYMLRNPTGLDNSFLVDEEREDQIATFLAKHEENLEITLGRWNSETRLLEADEELPSAVGVTMQMTDLPLFFGPLVGRDKFSISATSVAVYQPRDIVLVLDFSASMNDDSELRSISTVGQNQVEENIHQIWEELGSPTYGNLQFSPTWVTIPGNSLPFNVTWQMDKVAIEATTNMKQVKLFFPKGHTQMFTTSASSGTWEGSGELSGQRIKKVRVKINGQNETINFYNNNTLIRGLGLTNVNYPYASGSWGDFVEYCRSHSSRMPWYDYDVHAAGYRSKFGILTLINFWNRYKPMNSETADLWQVSTQPVTAVKDAVDVFMEYVQAVPTDDRVGLSVYNSWSGNGTLEHELTTDYETVVDITRHRQAGHYHHYTNIGGGLQKARKELEANAREGAFKMIVLMTDGKANWVNGGYDEDEADEFLRNEAELCEEQGFPVVTISLGADADTGIMSEVAEITGSVHFNIPGGQSVQDYSKDLIDVFETIAAHRPLKLVN